MSRSQLLQRQPGLLCLPKGRALEDESRAGLGHFQCVPLLAVGQGVLGHSVAVWVRLEAAGAGQVASRPHSECARVLLVPPIRVGVLGRWPTDPYVASMP